MVGNTNGTGLGLGKLGHGLPGVDNGDGVVNGNIGVIGEGEQFGAGLESHGPVHEVEVEVGELELGQTLIEGSLDIVGVMLGVPQLGGLELMVNRLILPCQAAGRPTMKRCSRLRPGTSW